MVAQVDAAAAVEARQNRQLAPLAAARQRTNEVLEEAEPAVRAAGAPTTAGSRRVAEASLATARAHQRRLEGEDDAARSGGSVARGVGGARRAVRGRARSLAPGRGDAGCGDRAIGPGRSAQAPLLEAVELGLRLGAKPLLRELRELAGRARIPLPPEVDAVARRRPSRRGRVGRTATVGIDGAAAPARRQRNGRSDLVRAIAGDPPAPPSGPTRSG